MKQVYHEFLFLESEPPVSWLVLYGEGKLRVEIVPNCKIIEDINNSILLIR